MGMGALPHPSWDGSVGGEEEVHMPAGITYVTEEHFFLVKWTLTYFALGILREGAGKGGGERRYGPGRG